MSADKMFASNINGIPDTFFLHDLVPTMKSHNKPTEFIHSNLQQRRPSVRWSMSAPAYIHPGNGTQKAQESGCLKQNLSFHKNRVAPLVIASHVLQRLGSSRSSAANRSFSRHGIFEQ